MGKIPVIDLAECTGCESCLELCSTVFRRNNETGFIEVSDLCHYPEDQIQETISVCPADCIYWEKS